ncbi:MAG: hypothetical protein ABS76_07170 [Pelagibacterium sp. SCN 64-44]|nr:MAG: hypothetical protein ABS76_07170 [Pelagibacterium sp. SCN 64-44]
MVEVSPAQVANGSSHRGASPSIDVLDGAEAMRAWMDFAETAQLTPYQAPFWLGGVMACFDMPRESFRLLMIHDAGTPRAALPLVLSRRSGCVLAEIPGSQLGNSDWFPQQAGPALDGELLDRAFAILARAQGVDILRFSNLPAAWQGRDNPLLGYPVAPAPDHFYVGPIGPHTRDSLPKRRRGDILRGQRRLEEMTGPVTLRRASTPAEVEAMHAAFLQQRTVRFREMGVRNIFAETPFRRLFDDLAKTSLAMDRPTLCFDALYGGDEILATAIGIRAGSHYSQYINSNASGPAAKYNLMGLLMYLLVERLVAEGVESLDMGVGDFAYKEIWTQKTAVYDLMLPLSLKGKLFAPAFGAKRAAKRLIKRNQQLWQVARSFRQLRQPKTES